MATRDAVLDDIVVGNRILAMEGVLDAYGHVSARDPDDPQRFLLSRSLAPELVTQADVMAFDLDGNPLHGDDRKPYLERFIHGSIYRARPDVLGVVHSHAPSVIPFAASSVKLRPIYHMGAFLGRGAPVFDIRHRFGCTDLLVTNVAQGDELARTLGPSHVALMRGHGFVATGPSVMLAVFRAVYTALNARLQQEAIGLGGTITFLELDEAETADTNISPTATRAWELWTRRVRASMGD